MSCLPQSILQYIEKYAVETPDAPIMLLPDEPPVSYSQFLSFINDMLKDLSRFGIKSNDRIAVVVSSPAVNTLAFFAVSKMAILVPLNPKIGRAHV